MPNGQSNGIPNSNGGVGADDTEESESLQYIKPANDDLTIAYSEGAQKTDLLYWVRMFECIGLKLAATRRAGEKGFEITDNNNRYFANGSEC